jgi:hypothetical protein
MAGMHFLLSLFFLNENRVGFRENRKIEYGICLSVSALIFLIIFCDLQIIMVVLIYISHLQLMIHNSCYFLQVYISALDIVLSTFGYIFFF